MDNLKYLIENNIVCLEQGINLLAAIEDDVYTHSDPPVYTSGIGDHYRHCVEHYLSFINGIEAQCIDYDARKRDLRVSTERDHAIQVTKEIIAALKGLSCPGAVVRVKMDCKLDEEDGAVWVDSTVERDLQYLQAHTIHHYALIAMIVRLQGIDPGEEFGVAPSTLTYRKRQMQAA